jgi:hypothetical protein
MSCLTRPALALGFVFVGSCDEDVTMGVVSTMMERDEAQLKDRVLQRREQQVADVFPLRTGVGDTDTARLGCRA